MSRPARRGGILFSSAWGFLETEGSCGITLKSLTICLQCCHLGLIAILNLNSQLSSDGFVVLQFGVCSYSKPLSSCPGKTPLYLAAQGGFLECVQQCLA
ncbi:hypothetical protein C5167_003093 [Papaver somniferum]|uniref:Uncharacterized protein n=1 Tax=Papaver somniferum TaxID=3469 RepID=A0A4Y7L3G3_PAPSO|nr:hypothetical protein C5167_003093 [Papaver somniferum]